MSDLLQDVPVVVEVAAVASGGTRCKGRAKTRVGDAWEVRVFTPEGMCARAFATLYPYILAMRVAPKTLFERNGDVTTITCPDGDVTFCLRRKQ